MKYAYACCSKINTPFRQHRTILIAIHCHALGDCDLFLKSPFSENNFFFRSENFSRPGMIYGSCISKLDKPRIPIELSDF